MREVEFASTQATQRAHWMHFNLLGLGEDGVGDGGCSSVAAPRFCRVLPI